MLCIVIICTMYFISFKFLCIVCNILSIITFEIGVVPANEQWENANLWLGPVLRHESLLHDMIEVRMRRKATRGRRRMHLLSDLMTGKYVALRRTAEDRKEWQKLLRAASRQITWTSDWICLLSSAVAFVQTVQMFFGVVQCLLFVCAVTAASVYSCYRLLLLSTAAVIITV